MKVKDLSQPLLSGRMGNLIYYVRNGCSVSGERKYREKTEERTVGSAKGVTGRFAIVQAFYAAYCRQVSRDIWRAAARAEGKTAHNLFNSTNCRCFSGEGSLWISSILLLRRGPCFCQGD